MRIAGVFGLGYDHPIVMTVRSRVGFVLVLLLSICVVPALFAGAATETTSVAQIRTPVKEVNEDTGLLTSSPKSAWVGTGGSAESTASQAAFFSIGSGYTDVVPHQVVRADDDRLYVFASQTDAPQVIRVYRTVSSGPPTGSTDFVSSSQDIDSDIVSVETAYRGGSTIHVLANTQSGVIRHLAFDVETNAFGSPETIASDGAALVGIGTSGLSAAFDLAGTLHIAYWSTGNHITHRAYTYEEASGTLALTAGPTQVDQGGVIARHPSLAVSPRDGSIVVAWVSPRVESSLSAGDILVRTRSNDAVWGTTATVNAAPAWTSTYFGADIDQGPSLLVTPDGTVHLAYIEHYDSTSDYGHVHQVEGRDATWTDQAVPYYSHDPALATNGQGEIYLIGHGHSLNATCASISQLCITQRQADGSWVTRVFATPTGTDSFDASTSVKWSAVGFNRPEAIEFAVFSAIGGTYDKTTLYYGRLP